MPTVTPSPIAGQDGEFSSLLPHPRVRRWKQPKAMATFLRNGTELKMSQYKRLTSLLGSLEGLLPYAELADQLDAAGRSGRTPPSLVVDPVEATKAGVEAVRGDTTSLRGQLEQLLGAFQHAGSVSASGETIVRVAGQSRPLGKFDSFGRIKAVGRRKEASARVWILPTAPSTSSADAAVPGQVLVNALPLPTYFSLPAQQQRTILPLSLTSALGSFNVFAIVKGGGLAAQADAVAMGLARALVEFEKGKVASGEWEEGGQGWRDSLRKGESIEADERTETGADFVVWLAAELLERDPRVVERKKTGQLKARKKFAWVKR